MHSRLELAHRHPVKRKHFRSIRRVGTLAGGLRLRRNGKRIDKPLQRSWIERERNVHGNRTVHALRALGRFGRERARQSEGRGSQRTAGYEFAARDEDGSPALQQWLPVYSTDQKNNAAGASSG